MTITLSGSLKETPAKLAYMAHLKRWAYARKTRLTTFSVLLRLDVYPYLPVLQWSLKVLAMRGQPSYPRYTVLSLDKSVKI